MVRRIGIVGGGPAGLMAAEVLSVRGHAVALFDAMPTVGRKFLMAGKSGLNLTHAEGLEAFVARFGKAAERLRPAIEAFTGADIRDWADGLGAETFIGSSGRVFPKAMKASPLLRAWLGRLERQGAAVHTRHRWIGFDGEALLFETPEGRRAERFDAVVLALGGASWPRLGSDAGWVPFLEARGVAVNSFRPANCGFTVGWSEVFLDRFAGQPVKAVTATSAAGTIAGEFVVSRRGVEGSLVYAHAAALRDTLEQEGTAALMLDLMPGRDAARLERDLARQPAKASFVNRLRKGAGLDGVKAGLVREFTSEAVRGDSKALAGALKALAIPVTAPRPIAEAISSAGGIDWAELDAGFQLRRVPGVHVAGEMLDWEAPTGGYLLSACLATGRAAGLTIARSG